MSGRMNAVERRIQSALGTLHDREPRRRWTDGEWTREVKHAVGGVGEDSGFEIYANRCKFKRNGEWLYDLVWLEQGADGELIDAPLVLESEWTPAGISDDFQKLLVARTHPGSTLISRTHPKRLILGLEACHGEAKEVF